MADIFDVTDKFRRKIPQTIKEGNEFIEHMKKRYLLIPKENLLSKTIEQCEASLNLVSTASMALVLCYENTGSEEAYHKITEYAEMSEKLEKLIGNLKANGLKLPPEKLVLIMEDQVKSHPRLMNNLLTFIEIQAMAADDEDDDDDDS